MLVSDYIAKYLVERNIIYAFGYPGGMVTYLMDSFNSNEQTAAFSLYHEQAAAFAACGYAQSSGHVGVAYATSGPGATNLITGICHAYFESVPSLFITGQVNTQEAKGNMKIRQRGFQETDVVALVNSVTKYCVYVAKAEDIKYHLDKALYYATEGRPGPVLLDIPIDIQRTEIDINSLQGFNQNKLILNDCQNAVRVITESLKESKRPVIILGNGIHIAGVSQKMRIVLNQLGIPVVSSMIAVDAMASSSDIYFGFIGAYGHRCANLIVAQSDLVISLGTRLDMRQTGANIKAFAQNARLVRIDIDSNEFENKIKDDEIDILADLKSLIPCLIDNSELRNYSGDPKWIGKCRFYKSKLDKIDLSEPNYLVQQISELIPDESIITTDVGQNQVWISQSFKVKPSQHILFSGGHGSMGYSLPAAIGAYYHARKPVYCFTGDGGFQMNIQELQYLVREKLPVKIFILNNHSLGMIRHFQEMYFDSNFTQTVKNQGYSEPDFVKIGLAYGINSFNISDIGDFKKCNAALYDQHPALFNVEMGCTTYVFPKLAFNKPIYDQDPAIDRALLAELLAYEG